MAQQKQQRRPRWRIVILGGRLSAVLALIVGLAAASPAMAQEGAAVPSVGDAVPFVGAEGGILAEITIDAVEDPFADYDPNRPPERSFHYVLLTVTVANTGNRPFAFDPNAVALQDTEGFLSRPSSVPRTEDSLADLPDFPAGEVAAGDTITGGLVVQVLNGPTLLHIVYLPANDRLVILAGLATGAASTPPRPAIAGAMRPVI